MADNTWTFVCAAETFDGPRIVREAKEAGLEVFQVSVAGKEQDALVFMTEAYETRLAKAGIQLGGCEGAAYPTLDARGLYWEMSNASPYVRRYFVGSYAFGGATAAELHARLLDVLERRGPRVRITIEGFK